MDVGFGSARCAELCSASGDIGTSRNALQHALSHAHHDALESTKGGIFEYGLAYSRGIYVSLSPSCALPNLGQDALSSFSYLR